MTEQHESNEQQQQTHDEAAQKAREETQRVVREAKDVRERVRDTILEATQDQSIGLGTLRSAASGAIDGVVQGARELSDAHRDSTGEAMSGVGDAVERGAEATKLAIQEAEARGEAFAKEDIDQAQRELESMTDTMTDMFRRAGNELQDQVKDFGEHFERTMKSIRPSIENALTAVREHPGKAASDAASIGVDAAGRLAKAAFGIAGGLVDGLRGAASGKDENKAEDKADHAADAGDKSA
jgi:ElaB/YqjD/DUF883 family membrane-anchored ribosome-binding protein